MAESRQFRRPSMEERWALIRVHEGGEDYYCVAEQLLQIFEELRISLILLRMRDSLK